MLSVFFVSSLFSLSLVGNILLQEFEEFVPTALSLLLPGGGGARARAPVTHPWGFARARMQRLDVYLKFNFRSAVYLFKFALTIYVVFKISYNIPFFACWGSTFPNS